MALKTLTIGGSDTWGGGGIQTDLKTFENLQTFGLSVLTCVAVEENDEFVIRPLPASLVKEQLTTIENSFDKLDGLKIGLLGSTEIMDVVIDFCKNHEDQFPIVIDPVMAFKETEQQLHTEYIKKIKELLSFATLTTPNIAEAKMLTGMEKIETLTEMKEATRLLLSMTNQPVILKGASHIVDVDYSVDFYRDSENDKQFKGPISQKKSINGAGCCFASAITGYLAHGLSMDESIAKSKAFVYEAIEGGILVGDAGNVWHPGIESVIN